MGKPKIRFKGYTEDWEQRKVLDLLIQPITDGPHETPKLVEKGVPFISVDAIVDNKIDFNRKRGNISEEYDELCCKKYKPQFHDVYLVKSGSTVGKVAIVETTDRFNIWSPLAAMRCGEKTYPYFLYDLLQTKDLQAQVADKASNGTQPNLSMRELEKFPVSVPSNLEEQKKIGDYFRSLDHLITLHQRKCDETKKLKKCMLQKMFPKEGEKVPEIRFSGFTGDWKQRKLGEVFEQTTNFVNPDKGEIELWSLTVEDGLTPKSERYNREFLVKKNANFKKVRPGDIVYNPMNMTLGAVGYNGMLKNVAVSGYYITMFVKTGYDSYYINTWLKSPQALSLYKTFATGSLIEKQRVQFSTLSIIPTVFPEYEEQKRIGCYFNNLDSLITFHHRKLNILNKICRYAWEQRKFDDLADYKKGPFGSALKKDLFVPKSEQQNAINKDWHLERYFITEEYANKLSGFRVEGGDIIVSCAGTIGETYEIPLDAEPGIINQALMRIKVKESIVNKKMFNILFTNMINDFTRVHSNGSAIKNIPPFSDLKPMVVFVPKMDEQNKISSYFSNLDHLITLHQQKCKQLQIIRKFMLKNMFL